MDAFPSESMETTEPSTNETAEQHSEQGQDYSVPAAITIGAVAILIASFLVYRHRRRQN